MSQILKKHFLNTSLPKDKQRRPVGFEIYKIKMKSKKGNGGTDEREQKD